MYTKILLAYIQKHKLTSLFWGYIFFSVLLNALTGVDVTIPCPIYKISGIQCLGCGLTTATILMLKLDFSTAWQINPLAFFMDPLLLVLFVVHFYRFIKKEGPKHTSYGSL